MFFIAGNEHELYGSIEAIGLKRDIINYKNALIKINLGRPCAKNRPRTDMALLGTVVSYIYRCGGTCAIAEGADGYLTRNLIDSGFGDMLRRYEIKAIDIDSECTDEVTSNGEKHYIPKCFKEYPVRIAIPAASKREGMIFSNNIKLFVGAVPRAMYQLDGAGSGNGEPRPKMHIDLHSSVANLFLALNSYSPFSYYINGGQSYSEAAGAFRFDEMFVGDDALELDRHIFRNFFHGCEYPGYMDILKAKA
jgi:uncharacterized protein (DUF362 family)